MRWLLSIAMAVALTGHPAWSQETAPAEATKAASANDIFSGTVVQMSTEAVTVIRKVRGQKDVTRTFALDQQTKIEGKLKPGARVTVQWQGGEEEPAHAVHIIVR